MDRMLILAATAAAITLAGCQQQEMAKTSAVAPSSAQPPAAAPATAPAPSGAATAAEHKGRGKVLSIDRPANRIRLAHDPIPELQWPAMAMDFTVRDGRLLDNMSTNQTVDFAFIEEGPGRYTITRIAPVT